MAIVPDIDEQQDPTGPQSIVVGEPENVGDAPDAVSYQPPNLLDTHYTSTPSTPAAFRMPGFTLAGTPGGSNSLRDRLITAGMRYIGQPYSWGNLDCSGLVQRAYAAIGINLPRISYQQAGAGKKVGLGALSPGDLVAWDEGPRNPGADHIAIFVGYDAKGRPQILEAAHTGTNVRVRAVSSNEGAWGVHMDIGG